MRTTASDTRFERARAALWKDYNAGRELVLSPADYEELRRELKIQPARVKDSRGAHYDGD